MRLLLRFCASCAFLRPSLLILLAAFAGHLAAQPANVQADPTTGVLSRPSAATFISGNNLATATGGIVLGANGGTGVANTGKTITLGGNVTTSGSFGLTLTLSGTTNVTLPTSGQLATLAGSEVLTNKTLSSPTLTTPTLGAATATSLTLSGNISSAAWTTSGVRIKGVTATLTDTTSTGTVAAAYTDVLGGNTIAASNATTYTDYITAYFREPTAGSLVTMTNRWALGSESLRVGTSTPMTVSTAGAITANSLTGRTTTDLTLAGGTAGTSSVVVSNTTEATTTTSGALRVGSNVGLSGNAGGASYFGGDINVNSTSGSNIIANDPTFNHPVILLREAGVNKAAFETVSGDAYVSTQTAGKSLYLRSGNATTALTLASTGAATFAGTATLYTVGASSTGENSLIFTGADGNGNVRTPAKITGKQAGNGGYGSLVFQTAFNNSLVDALTINSSQAATFAGAVSSGTTSTSGTQFDASATGASSSSGGAFIRVGVRDGAALASGDRLGGVLFNGSTGASTDENSVAIFGYANDTWSAGVAPGRLDIDIAPAGSATRVNQLRLTATTATFAGAVTVSGGSNTTSAGAVNLTSSSYGGGYTLKDGTKYLGLFSKTSGTQLCFYTNQAAGTDLGSLTPDLIINTGTSTFAGAVTVSSSTASTNTTSGALVVTGGVGVGGALNVGGAVTVAMTNPEIQIRSTSDAAAQRQYLTFGSTTYNRAQFQSVSAGTNDGSLELRTFNAGTQTLSQTWNKDGSSTFAGAVTVNGAVTTSSTTLSGAGAIPITTSLVKFTSTAAANALTLANGVDGQRLTIVHDVKGMLGTGVLTPTTKTGFSTITFTNAGDTVSLVYVTTRGWMVTGSYLATIAP